jgi:SAM-dependent methyltransferase
MNRNQAGFSPQEPENAGSPRPVDAGSVRAWFSDPVAVDHYTRAAASLGLWRAEEVLLRQIFRREHRLLDMGCGAGRIAFGLWLLEYRNLRGIDFCQPMIERAHELAREREISIRFDVGDATNLDVEDGIFDGAIFGFNGLMQIPGREHRRRALMELHRVVRSGGRIVFTTHDRDLRFLREYWDHERERWSNGTQSSHLVEFGDRILRRDEGVVFMHVPDRVEILDDLSASGWTHEFDELRSRIANEPPAVRDFADECRFWIAQA